MDNASGLKRLDPGQAGRRAQMYPTRQFHVRQPPILLKLRQDSEVGAIDICSAIHTIQSILCQTNRIKTKIKQLISKNSAYRLLYEKRPH
jgi:hypothetical protein